MEADESQFEDLPSRPGKFPGVPRGAIFWPIPGSERPRKPAAKAKSGAAPKAATRTLGCAYFKFLRKEKLKGSTGTQRGKKADKY